MDIGADNKKEIERLNKVIEDLNSYIARLNNRLLEYHDRDTGTQRI